VRDEAISVELVTLQQAQEGGRGKGVDQPGRDGDVFDPKLLKVQGSRLAMYADVGDVAAGSNQLCGEFEGGRNAQLQW
jgi:hypothetical protein